MLFRRAASINHQLFKPPSHAPSSYTENVGERGILENYE